MAGTAESITPNDETSTTIPTTSAYDDSNCNDAVDYFDLGEDMSSHNFSYTGRVATGSSYYFCDNGNDKTIRIGSCSNAQGNASWTMASGDEITFIIAVQTDHADIYIDGELLGNISDVGLCQEITFELPDTIGTTFQVEVRDPTFGCGGDVQIAAVCVANDDNNDAADGVLQLEKFSNCDRLVGAVLLMATISLVF